MCAAVAGDGSMRSLRALLIRPPGRAPFDLFGIDSNPRRNTFAAMKAATAATISQDEQAEFIGAVGKWRYRPSAASIWPGMLCLRQADADGTEGRCAGLAGCSGGDAGIDVSFPQVLFAGQGPSDQSASVYRLVRNL